jgi:tRNA G10  N-methylase Trm11
MIEALKEYLPTKTNTTLSGLVTARQNKNTPIYDWYIYPHSFARGLVHYLLDELSIEQGSSVLDPCVGAGSTILACKERGVSAVGYDILPLSVLITNVKTRDYNVQALKNDWTELLSRDWSSQSIKVLPDMAFFTHAYDTQVLNRILQVREAINQIDNVEHREFYLLGLTSILGELSKTAKSGGWLRWRDNCHSTPGDVEALFKARIKKMLDDLSLHAITSPSSGFWQAHQGDARSLPEGELYDAIITSPPYPNRHDYTRIFVLELIIPFILTEDSLKHLRYNTLRSHVEAKSYGNDDSYAPPQKLSDLLKMLNAASLNNLQVPRMVYGYFEDMYLMLRGLFQRTKTGGSVAFVLGNVRFGGVTIPVDEIVAEIGEQVGFKWQQSIVARLRGNSAQQMGRFGKELSRESVIIWRK